MGVFSTHLLSACSVLTIMPGLGYMGIDVWAHSVGHVGIYLS